MSVVTDECINVAMTAFYQSRGGYVTSIRAVLAVVAPLIAKAERERCAKVADEVAILLSVPSNKWVASEIAAAIRALEDAP